MFVHLFFQLGQASRFAHNQAFGNRMFHGIQKIVYLLYFHDIEQGLFEYILIVRFLGQHVFPVVSHNGKIVLFGTFVKIGKHIMVEQVLVHQLLGFPVDDFSTVVSQNVAFILLQFQLLGQWGNAVRRSSRGQYNFHSLLLNLEQCFLGVRGNFFLLVGKRSVKV